MMFARDTPSDQSKILMGERLLRSSVFFLRGKRHWRSPGALWKSGLSQKLETYIPPEKKIVNRFDKFLRKGARVNQLCFKNQLPPCKEI
jgi:hypothetical protein